MASEFISNSEQESINFAKEFATKLKPGNIVTFSGDLGSGKTFLCRQIIKELCGQNTNVISPTFNLLQTYELPQFTIYHFDLYRLRDINEIYELGIEEAFAGNLCLIEWPEIIRPILPKDVLNIEIEIASEQCRRIFIN
ncbi:MAG: tRNA (adenosine(37)-N6)-threonylcarbamoyltransferase complex ATPase subunit type 1 TsaE [Rickettsiales bacterium]|nr:tRNA (adenosine(37)-N6)-threonylcarbamoyltransferase complex ATPase subunit type 1 TsaE [Rickettsiales bacterium]